MQADRPAAKAQRLALLFRGAGAHWAIPASAVLEVAAAPAPGERAQTRNGLEIESFAALLGEQASLGPQAVTLVLDSAPPRALLVDAIEEAADLADAAFFRIPASLGARSQLLVRGVLRRGERLLLEIDPQALAGLHGAGDGPRWRPRLEPGAPIEPPSRALVFEIGGGALAGFALSLVTGVLRIGELCRLPGAPSGLVGLLYHERSLLPVYDISLSAGGPPTGGDLAVALEIGGSAVGMAARSVVGVLEGLSGPAEPAPGGACLKARDGRRVFFAAAEAWFP
jgi:chemotaxis signal transduction protein